MSRPAGPAPVGAGPGAPLEPQRLWDAPVRIVHWALLLLVLFSWWSGENNRLDWHRYSGYAVFGLLLFRVYWGVVGSSPARFASFVRGPRAVLRYARSLRDPGHLPWAGHNPMGGWSVLALLVVLFAQVGSGLFAVDTDGLESGPLSHWVSFGTGRAFAEAHEIAFNLLMVLVGLHVLAIVGYRVVKRQHLVRAMVTGVAALPRGATERLRFAGWGRALAGAALAAVIVYAVATGLRF
ncbi:MAG: cytochrome b/b6 domain-containing protein [Nevskiales bacterium]|nr:cytochrome b/b6 domain-containing protein [Nevskiales bacterium]